MPTCQAANTKFFLGTTEKILLGGDTREHDMGRFLINSKQNQQLTSDWSLTAARAECGPPRPLVHSCFTDPVLSSLELEWQWEEPQNEAGNKSREDLGKGSNLRMKRNRALSEPRLLITLLMCIYFLCWKKRESFPLRGEGDPGQHSTATFSCQLQLQPWSTELLASWRHFYPSIHSEPFPRAFTPPRPAPALSFHQDIFLQVKSLEEITSSSQNRGKNQG